MPTHKIICGKSEIELKRFDDNTFDSCVTDPPYGLEFMGEDWDKFDVSESRAAYLSSTQKKDCEYKLKGEGRYSDMTLKEKKTFQQFTHHWATELYRLMKPGAHILVFGGTRTYHRMACAIEDAGFEVRDMVEWFYGQGFPKSLNISKSLDKMAGKEREVTTGTPKPIEYAGKFDQRSSSERIKDIPSSEEAILWNGWGTGLKPAHEPILLARKPISERNIASNVLKWSVGGINVDGCRIPTDETLQASTTKLPKYKSVSYFESKTMSEPSLQHPQGRFPANLILDEEAGKMLDEQSKNSKPTKPHLVISNIDAYEGWGSITQKKGDTINYAENTSGASRFFYQAKASQKERWFYCTICKQAYPMKERDEHTHNAPKKEKYKYLEFHPTQKPEALICYLARLITPPNGTMLDLFLGSGTGLIAAEREGFNSFGIDSKREYCLISCSRLKNEIEQEQRKLTVNQSTIEKIGF